MEFTTRNELVKPQNHRTKTEGLKGDQSEKVFNTLKQVGDHKRTSHITK